MDKKIPVTTKSFRELLERELNKRGGGRGGNDNDDKGKPDRPDGPDLILALIIGALTAITLTIMAKSKSKTKNS